MAPPKKYPDELRARAVRLYRESDPKPVIRRLAGQLGVHPEALRNWIRQDEADRGERDDRPTATESKELRRLRKENAELKRANEILKTASAFFAAEPDPTRRRSRSSSSSFATASGSSSSSGSSASPPPPTAAGWPDRPTRRTANARTGRSPPRSPTSTPPPAAPTAARGCTRCCGVGVSACRASVSSG
ncbi:hypothetical protein BN6_33330 [Saccharothrix espanaensis DSM 44229]|uniref:Transposase n=1 Tax=Saccharothrix espanaensis (strain ATCC 51144 / DSM 44229 / JCM 9112 / NBRC 15066 / NRRL 15764) TaxID=1179773 RepID=K0JSI3_SACES|nr:hypothetical protein BN6_33330 [Saccharothrix espanaensis DSM 44229]